MRGQRQNNARTGQEEEEEENLATDLPLKCICNLCDCGAHRCADFNFWASTNGRSHSMEDQNQQEQHHGQEWRQGRHAAAPACHDHAAALEERYLTISGGGVGGAKRGGKGARSRHEESESQLGQEADHHQGARSARDVDELARDEELLHVLVTRPEIASKPRDNIVFEGDMDLRTTFETSYEALARMRLEHWKSHQRALMNGQGGGQSIAATRDDEIKGASRHEQQQQQQQRRDARAAGESRGGRASRERRALQQTTAADGAPDAVSVGATGNDGRSSTLATDDNGVQPLTSARLIRAPARLRGGDSLVGTGLALGQVQHSDQLEAQQQQREQRARQMQSPQASERAFTPLANHTEPAAQQPLPPAGPPDQASPFVDPDLSPIIVYDANLNRLERVGLRKRSKYRPSTSLRPGGRGFFGGDGGDSAGDNQSPALDQEEETTTTTSTTDGHARLGKRDVARQQAASPGALLDGPAGATSESLNRDRNAGDKCGRKHNLAHVNRVDHIKEFNLVESTDPAAASSGREFRDKATLTELAGLGRETERAKRSVHAGVVEIEEGVVGGGVSPQASRADEGTRMLALAEEEADEEAAAVAEIQRATANAGGEGYARDTRTPLVDAPPATVAAAAANPRATPTWDSEQRGARMQRVCQNQSFNIHENEYPEVRGGVLTSCIKIGGRDSADVTVGGVGDGGQPSSRLSMASSSGGHTTRGRNNLFRESPDFIMTTTSGRLTTGGKHSREAPPSTSPALDGVAELTTPQGRPQETEEGAQVTADQRTRDKSLSRNSNLHVEFNGTGDESHNMGQMGRESAMSESALETAVTSGGGRCLKCRVLDLGHDFEFVGSRSGHKYFVERHLEAPISEMT